MAIITPSVTAQTPDVYSQQIEKIAPFLNRLHVDSADGEFAPKLLNLEQCWWPVGVIADLHLMHRRPWSNYHTILSLRPSLVIVHAEADLEDMIAKIAELHQMGIAVGIAFLKETPISAVDPHLLALVDHALLFSGDLGHFGGEADLSLLTKIPEERHQTRRGRR
jgi:ribulose-phosphate 3-epimerase